MNLVSNCRRIGRAMLQRFRQDFGRQHMACRGGGGGSCVRRSRVGLASVADAKSAEAMSGPTGSAAPSIRETTVTKRNSSPGRARRKPLKPFACGNAGRLRWTCGDYRVLTTNAHGLRVPLSTRHSPRPHCFKGGKDLKPRAERAASANAYASTSRLSTQAVAMNAASASRSAAGMVSPSLERRHRMSSGKRAHSLVMR
jgi:hypothetical protein